MNPDPVSLDARARNAHFRVPPVPIDESPEGGCGEVTENRVLPDALDGSEQAALKRQCVVPNGVDPVVNGVKPPGLDGYPHLPTGQAALAKLIERQHRPLLSGALRHPPFGPRLDFVSHTETKSRVGDRDRVLRAGHAREVAFGAVVGQHPCVTDLGRVCARGLDILNTVDTQSRRQSVEAVRHQLRPLFDQVVVKELDQDRMRRSGLVVPSGTHDPPPQQGIVLAVGPGLDWWEQAGVEMPVQPGDHVVFPASAGVWVEVDEERLLVCRVVELLGILESTRAEPEQG